MPLAMLLPIVMLIIFGIVQGGLWFHARSLALGGAQEGARLAAADGGGNGVERAHEFITGLTGGTLISDLVVTQTSNGAAVTVTVTGSAPSLIPGGGTLTVVQSATSPIEQITPP